MKFQRIVFFATLFLFAGAASARERQDVPIRVIPIPKSEAYVGYMYVRFNQGPGAHLSRNGFDSSLTSYVSTHLGFEGSLFGGYGGQFGDPSRFLFAGGGPRIRYVVGSKQFWIHALVGRSHYIPQTARGPQGAFAYEIGGGMDLPLASNRLAYRTQFDMVETQYFHAFQMSPKVSVGFVLKF